MLTLVRTKTYLKDTRRATLSDKHFTKFVQYLGLLSSGEHLPEEVELQLLQAA